MNDTTTLNEDFITTKEASRLFKYTSSYIAYLVRAKKINAHRLGRSWLIEHNSLQRFVAQRGKQNTSKVGTSIQLRIQKKRTYEQTSTISVPSPSIQQPRTIPMRQSVSGVPHASSSTKWIETVPMVILIVFTAVVLQFVPSTLQSFVFSQSVSTLQALPGIINQTPLALGEFVISATHSIIAADVALMYGIATIAPATAYVAVKTFINVGDHLSRVVERIPAQVASVSAYGTQ